MDSGIVDYQISSPVCELDALQEVFIAPRKQIGPNRENGRAVWKNHLRIIVRRKHPQILEFGDVLSLHHYTYQYAHAALKLVKHKFPVAIQCFEELREEELQELAKLAALKANQNN